MSLVQETKKSRLNPNNVFIKKLIIFVDISKHEVRQTAVPFITVKHVRTSSFGLCILRSCYALVALLVFGFLFMFCVQVVLFLFFNLVHDCDTGQSAAVVGALASMPALVFSNASAMSLGWLFVKETRNSHKLLLSMSSESSNIIEWMSFVIFLGIPSLTISIKLFLGLSNW